MNACYRIWARQLAFALLNWLNSWAPPSLVGSRRRFSADATAQDVAEIINRARAGERPPLYVLSLDQSKFFDRLSLPVQGCSKQGTFLRFTAVSGDSCGLMEPPPAQSCWERMRVEYRKVVLVWLQVVSDPRLQTSKRQWKDGYWPIVGLRTSFAIVVL